MADDARQADLRGLLAEALHAYDCRPGAVCFACADEANALLPVVERFAAEQVAAAYDDFADLIDRGPTFPMPPSIFSAMAHERAEDIRQATAE